MKKNRIYLDKAYRSKEIEQEIVNRGYIPHIQYRRIETHQENLTRKLVVERTNS